MTTQVSRLLHDREFWASVVGQQLHEVRLHEKRHYENLLVDLWHDLWEGPHVARSFGRLGSFARNIWFDHRGSGSRSALTPEMFYGRELYVDGLGAVMAAAF